jgi:branched-chain amino acid transport system permease protein
LRNSPKVSVLISAIGVSFLLESLGVVIFGGIQKAFPIPDIFGKVVVIAGISIVSVKFFHPHNSYYMSYCTYVPCELYKKQVWQ